MPQYTGVNHLALVTGDMDMTVRFWRDLLELPLVAGLGRPGYRQYFFSLSCGARGGMDMIGFFEWDGVTPVEEKDHGAPVQGKVAFDHVAIGVAGVEDLWELYDKLAAADIWTSELVDHGFIYSLYTFDPNGIAIEFSAPVPDVDLCRDPRMTDSVPSPAALEGALPQSGVWPDVTAPTAPEERAVYPGEGHDFIHAKYNHWDRK